MDAEPIQIPISCVPKSASPGEIISAQLSAMTAVLSNSLNAPKAYPGDCRFNRQDSERLGDRKPLLLRSAMVQWQHLVNTLCQ